MPTANIRVQPTEGDWVVRVDGAVIGESHRALELIEDDCAPVLYFPPEDVAMAFLERSETTVQSIRKGAATYYNIVTRSGRSRTPRGRSRRQRPRRRGSPATSRSSRVS